MKRVLLTGASGFVGSHVLRHLLVNTNWRFVCPVTFRHRGNADRLANVFQDHPEWKSRIDVVLHDLSAPVSLTGLAGIGAIDYVVNVASESHVDRSITEPADFVSNNVALILNVLELARELQPEIFLQISTDEVYGPAPAGHAHAEWEPILPSNPYSASKAAQEAIAFSYWRTYGVPLIVTNTMNIIGETQDREKFVPKVMRSVLRDEVMPVHVSPTGQPGSRFYLHARNQADALLFILQNVRPTFYPDVDRPERFNVVGEVELDNIQMVELIGKMMGEQPKMDLVDFHGSRPGHDLRYALDGEKLAKLGWAAPLPLDVSLKRTIDWTMANPKWLL